MIISSNTVFNSINVKGCLEKSVLLLACDGIKLRYQKFSTARKGCWSAYLDGYFFFLLATCDYEPIGVVDRSIIKNSQMTSSSYHSVGVISYNGRLNAWSAWCAKTNAGNDWLQIDMGTVKYVCGVGLQGKEEGTDEWTKTYKVGLSVDGTTWTPYKENGQEKVRWD